MNKSKILKNVGLSVLCVFAVLLSTLLCSCGKKGASVSFTKDEYVFFVNAQQPEDIDFAQLIENASGVSVQELEFGFSVEGENALFEKKSANTFVAKKSGKCSVYAIYNGNVVGSAKVVVGRPFDAPSVFAPLTIDNKFSWETPGQAFEDGATYTQPSSFVVEGTVTTFSQTSRTPNEETEEFFVETTSNSVTLSKEGIYNLTVTAKANGYFSDSAPSAQQIVYVNFMNETSIVGWDDNTGVLSWQLGALPDVQFEEGQVLYQVKVDNWTSLAQQENSYNLSEVFETLDAGRHEVSIFTQDNRNVPNEQKKLTRETKLSITKLAQPTVEYDFSSTTGGRLKISCPDLATTYNLTLTAQNVTAQESRIQQKTIDVATGNQYTYYDLQGVLPGVYTGTISAHKQSLLQGQNAEFFYHSQTKDLDCGALLKLDTISLQGQQNNSQDQLNANTFSATIKSPSNAQVATNFLVFGIGQNAQNINGLGVGTNQKQNVAIAVEDPGQYNILLKHIAQNATQNFVDGQQVCVINSDQTTVQQAITKVGGFSQPVVHQQRTVQGQQGGVETVSVLSTKLAEFATQPQQYVLYRKISSSFVEVSSQDYRVEISGENVSFVFTNKIEQLYQAQDGKFEFRICTNVQPAQNTINSSVEKQLTQLSSPEFEQQDKSTTCQWQAQPNASRYRVKIFGINKNMFSAGMANVDTERSDVILLEEKTVPGTSTEILQAGYYYVEVYSLSGNVNSFVDSTVPQKCLKVVQENLQLGQVEFGHTQTPFSAYTQIDEKTGFFLKIENTQNVSNFVVSVNGQQLPKVEKFDGDFTFVFVSADFAENQTISVVAHSDDDDLFVPTQPLSFSVQRQKTVLAQNVKTNANTSIATLKAEDFEHANGMQIWLSDENFATEPTGDVNFDISNLGNAFDLTFSVFGTKTKTQTLSSGLQEYEIFDVLGGLNNAQIYLDSTSTIHFQRITQPSALSYISGKLNFSTTKQQADKTDFYVLDLDCVRIGQPNMKIGARFESDGVKIVYGNSLVVIDENSSLYVQKSTGALEEAATIAISIDVDKLIEKMKENSGLLSLLGQIDSIKFSVWAYAWTAQDGQIEISSQNATTADMQTQVSVQKLKMTQVNYNTETGNLEWEQIVLPDGVSGGTKFVVCAKEDGILVDEQTISTTTFLVKNEKISLQPGKTYEFYVIAQNEKCIQSAVSNTVTLRKLSALQELTLSENANISYTLGQESSLAGGVKYQIDQGEFVQLQSTSGAIALEKPGQYNFVVTGKQVLGSTNALGLVDKTYYLDSQPSTWTLHLLEEEIVAPTSKDVEASGTTISWQAFGKDKNLQSLQYFLVFKQNAHIAKFFTTQTSVDIADQSNESIAALRASLQSFAAGEIEVFVYAKLGAQTVAAGGEMFFAVATTLQDGSLAANCFAYNGTSLEKLANPTNAQLQFVDAKENGKAFSAENGNLDKAQNPFVKVEFDGEYGPQQTTATFQVFAVAQQQSTTENFVTKLENISKQENGKFGFVLALSDIEKYLQAAGQKLVLRIYAIARSDKQAAIPSSFEEISIVRADALSGIQFVSAGPELGFLPQLEIFYQNAQTLLGGVVLKISTYTNQQTAQEATNTFVLAPFVAQSGNEKFVFPEDASLQLQRVLAEKLANGGKVCIEAFANNYAANGMYIISSLQSENVVGQTYQFLAPLANENFQAREYGFEIVNEPNAAFDGTVYVVTHNSKTYQVRKDAEGKFLFVFPDDWQDGEYQFQVYAAHADMQTSGGTLQFVQSVTATVSYSLRRAQAVTSVTLSRQVDTFKQQLSWENVENNNGYLLQVFALANGMKGELLATKTIEKVQENPKQVSISVLEVLGQTGQQAEQILKNNANIWIEISTLGGQQVDGKTLSNSKVLGFACKITQNNVDLQSFSAPFGVVFVSGQVGQKLLYRIVDANAAVLQNWKIADATLGQAKIEFSEELTGQAFLQNLYVQVVCMGADSATYTALGSNTNSGASQAFVLDSVLFGTKSDEKELAFQKMPPIENISYQAENVDAITITLARGEKLFVGLSEDALENSTLLQPTVAALVLENADSSTGKNVFKISFMQILQALENVNITLPQQNFKLYFWAVDAFDANTANLFGFDDTSLQGSVSVASKAYAFDCGIVPIQFSQIIKLSQADQGFNPLSNHFALFQNTDALQQIETLGFYVRICKVEENGNSTIVQSKFLPATDFAQIPQNTKLNNFFAVDLMKLFSDAALKNVFGKLTIEFAKIAIKQQEGNAIYLASNWQMATWEDAGGQTSIFQRLADVSDIALRQGNLFWQAAESEKDFNVYFVPNLLADGSFVEFSHFTATESFFNPAAAEVAGNNFYIAVQAKDVSLGVLASNLQFLRDKQSSAALAVYKNQILSNFALKNGSLSLEWNKDGDFIKALANTTDASSVAQALLSGRFESPASFTLSDLFSTNDDEALKIRFRFSPLAGAEGISKTVDVQLWQLLDNLNDFWNDQNIAQGKDLQAWLGEIAAASNDASILALANFAKQKHFGVASASTLFDDFFEKLSTGGWKMEYCLLGNNKTLTSHWQTFKIQNEAQVFVNAVPAIKIVKDTQSSAFVQPMKVVITLSSLYQKTESGTVECNGTAQDYILRIGTELFAINSTSLTHLDGEDGKTVAVYKCNAAGGTENADENHIMFYLNYNTQEENGSFVAAFEYLFENAQDLSFDIVAVGNDVGFSSKSETYNFNILNFENFEIENGTFSWQNDSNRQVAVVLDREISAEDEVRTQVDGKPITTSYRLDGIGFGQYRMVKFVILGGVEGNKIFVDSKILQIENVFKLATPNLANTFGNIFIDSTQNAEFYEKYHSDNEKRAFKVFNNTVTEDKGAVFTGKSDSTFYEVGITGFDESEPEFEYKSTEQAANKFFVQSVGSTSKFQITDGENCFEKKLVPINKQGQVVPGLQGAQMGIAAASEFASLDAAMICNVEDIKIENGQLVWSLVLPQAQTQGNALQVLPGNVIYKVKVQRYKNSYNAQGGFDLEPLEEEQEFFTKQTTFNFENVQKSQFDELEGTFYKTTVQALALEDVQAQETYKKQLVENAETFVGGNVEYQNTQPATFALMGNGQILKQISRLKAVDPNTIVVDQNGRLSWQYTPQQIVQDEAEFESLFGFVVQDGQKVVQGAFDIEKLADENTFKITFFENAGQLKAGTYPVSITVTPLKNTLTDVTDEEDDNPGADGGKEGDASSSVEGEEQIFYINSYATQKQITKLAAITNEYEILSDILYETFSLKTYFFAEDGQPIENHAQNTVTATFVLQGQPQTVKTFKFTSENYNLVVLRAQPQGEFVYPDDETYIKDDFLVVEDASVWQFTLQVSNETDISSDETQPFVMNRTMLDNVQIDWDENEQVFKWNFESDLSDIDPTFVVQASYTLGGGNVVTRVYQTKQQTFVPTIITPNGGNVQISLRVKINPSSILSAEIQSPTGQFNLFESGDGSSAQTAYKIANEQQFQNIAKRLEKDESLCRYSYISNGNTISSTEEKSFYFQIEQNLQLNLQQFEGFAIAGIFQGILNGNGCTISFNSTGVARLSSNIVVGQEISPLVPKDPREDISYTHASALFEGLGNLAQVANLKISAQFGQTQLAQHTTVAGNSVFAGLTVKNEGIIQNVEVTEFQANISAIGVGKGVLAFAGIAGINDSNSSISDCKLLCNVSLSDFNLPTMLSFGGIAYTNLGSISQCVCGVDKNAQGNQNTISVVIGGLSSQAQVAGIAVANGQNYAKIANCTNNSNISVSKDANSQATDLSAAAAGVVVLGLGTISCEGGNTGTISIAQEITKQKSGTISAGSRISDFS